MISSKTRSSKKSLDLEFSLTDGSTLRGKIFVPVQARLTDVLNDQWQFLPIEKADGVLLALAKSSIKHVTIPAS